MKIRRHVIRKYAKRLARLLMYKETAELERIIISQNTECLTRQFLGEEVMLKLARLGGDFEVSITYGVFGSIFPVGEIFTAIDQ